MGGVVGVAVVAAVAWWLLPSRESGDRRPAVRDVPATAGSAAERPRPPAPVAVDGVVVDARTSRPIAGAAVSLFRPRQTAPVVESSDGGGRWRFDAIEPGSYQLVVSAAGYAAAVMPLDVPATGVEIALERDDLATVSGVVSDVEGGPVAGAVVAAKPAILSGAEFDRTAPLPAVTDGQGRYALSLAPGHYELAAWADGYVSERRYLRVERRDAAMDFALWPACAIEGRVVVRDTGRPAAGVEVVAQPRGASATAAGEFEPPEQAVRAVAGAGGQFRLDGLRAGGYALYAQGGGYNSAVPLDVDLAIGETATGVVIQVVRGYTVSGRIVRADTGAPVSGATVSAMRDGDTREWGQVGPTGEDGRFTLSGLPAGHYTLFAEAVSVSLEPTGADVEVAGDVDGVEVRVSPGATVEGRVDPPGRAIVGLAPDYESLTFEGLAAAMLAEQLVSRRTGEDGRFALSPVPPGRWRVVARADAGAGGEVAVDVPPGGARDVVVPLQQWASVRGRVVDQTGAPVPGVTVMLQPVHVPGAIELQFRLMRRQYNVDGVLTDAKGVFAFDSVSPGEYAFVVGDAVGMRWWAPSGFDPQTNRPRRYVLGPGARLEDVVIEVTTADGVITGRVVDTKGAAVPDVYVVARLVAYSKGNGRWNPTPYGGRVPPVVTDAQGRFELTRLRRGRYDLHVDAPGDIGRGTANDVATGADVTIRLEPLGAIAGSAPGASGACDVAIIGPTQRVLATAEPACGFRAGRLSPGTYRVILSSNTGIGTAQVDVAAGDVARVDLPIRPWARVIGRVVERDGGRPVGGVRIAAVPEDEFLRDAVVKQIVLGLLPVTGDDGRFAVERVAPGAIDLWVIGDAGVLDPLLRQRVDTRPGATTDAGDLAVARGDSAR